MEKIEKSIAEKIPEEIRTIHKVLRRDAELHLVGGCVRDALRNRVQKDFDLATKLPPEEVINRFQDAGFRFVETGIRRGTVTVVVNFQNFEITTFRVKGEETRFSKTIEEDLSARDFTINAIAFSLNDNKLIDPFDGVKDIENRILRTVGNAEDRFNEDPHRILRGIRFAANGFPFFDEELNNATINLAHRLEEVATERIQAEFEKIMLTPNVSQALADLQRIGFFEIFLPEFVKTFDCAQNNHHKHDVWTHTCLCVDNTPANLVVRLAALFHDVGKPLVKTKIGDKIQFLGHEEKSAEIAQEALTRMKFPRKVIDAVVLLVAEHMRDIHTTPKSVRKTMRKLGEQFENWIILKKADRTAGRAVESEKKFEEEWKKFIEAVEKEKKAEIKLPFRHLNIDGRDIMKLGVKEGPEVGRILKELEEFVIENPCKNRKDFLITKVKEICDK